MFRIGGCNLRLVRRVWTGTDMNLRGIFVLAVMIAPVHSGAQAQTNCSGESDADVRAQCEQALRNRESIESDPNRKPPGQIVPVVIPPTPTPPPPPPRTVDLDALVRDACGLRLRPTSGAPGERETIV